MTHDELTDKIDVLGHTSCWVALRAIVELHKPRTDVAVCIYCSKTGFWITYPCPTIKAIEKELQ